MRHLLILLIVLSTNVKVYSSDLPSTYFSFYIPSNNEAEESNGSLLVTAIYDSTFVEIIDDDTDGDNDDSYSGYLNAGESFMLNIKDNAINDNAPYVSEGILKSDGDYFTVSTNKLVYASKSNNIQWQLDYSPSIDRSSSGQRFIYHANKHASNVHDLNVIVFEDQTEISVKDITISKFTHTESKNIERLQDSNVIQQTVDAGIHIIHRNVLGEYILENGHTYLIESNKAIDVQSDPHLDDWHIENSNMSVAIENLSKELFYLTAPKQHKKEQKVRIISWDETNIITIEQFSNGSWITLQNWGLEKMGSKEWSYEAIETNQLPVFRVRCSKGKTISIFAESDMEITKCKASDQGLATISSEEK